VCLFGHLLGQVLQDIQCDAVLDFFFNILCVYESELVSQIGLSMVFHKMLFL